MFIASMDPGCYTPLILLSPATFLQHTWQTHSHLGKTRLQLCCCVVTCTACHSDHVLLSIILFKALSLFFSSPLSHIHCYCLHVQSSACALPVPPIIPQWAQWGKLSPAASLEVGLHYPLPMPPPKKSIFVLSPAMPHRDMILTLCSTMADVSFFTLLFSRC